MNSFSNNIENLPNNLISTLSQELVGELKRRGYSLIFAKLTSPTQFSLGVVDRTASNPTNNFYASRISEGILKDSHIAECYTPLTLNIRHLRDPCGMQTKFCVEFQPAEYSNGQRKIGTLNIRCPFNLNKGDKDLFLELLKSTLSNNGVNNLNIDTDFLQRSGWVAVYLPFLSSIEKIAVINGDFTIQDLNYQLSVNSERILISCIDKRIIYFTPVSDYSINSAKYETLNPIVDNIINLIDERFRNDEKAFEVVAESFEKAFDLLFNERYEPVEIVF